MKTYNHTDGYTYFNKNNILMGCPTNIDETPDYENEIPVSEYAEPLSKKEIEIIKQKLK